VYCAGGDQGEKRIKNGFIKERKKVLRRGGKKYLGGKYGKVKFLAPTVSLFRLGRIGVARLPE